MTPAPIRYSMPPLQRTDSGRPAASIRFRTATPMEASVCWAAKPRARSWLRRALLQGCWRLLVPSTERGAGAVRPAVANAPSRLRVELEAVHDDFLPGYEAGVRCRQVLGMAGPHRYVAEPPDGEAACLRQPARAGRRSAPGGAMFPDRGTGRRRARGKGRGRATPPPSSPGSRCEQAPNQGSALVHTPPDLSASARPWPIKLTVPVEHSTKTTADPRTSRRFEEFTKVGTSV